jgi:adenylate cyclase, class 2
MNEEIEIKEILKNPQQIEDKLKQIAKFVKEKTQIDEYFTPKHENYFELKRPVKYIRVRHEDNKSNVEFQFLHFEGDSKNLIKTDEYETKVEDPKMMSIILKKLDMVHKVTVKKQRKQFDYKDFEIVIDNVEQLGYFIEVEAKKLLGSLKETKQACFNILEEIGAEWEHPTLGGYPILILEKNDTK